MKPSLSAKRRHLRRPRMWGREDRKPRRGGRRRTWHEPTRAVGGCKRERAHVPKSAHKGGHCAKKSWGVTGFVRAWREGWNKEHRWRGGTPTSVARERELGATRPQCHAPGGTDKVTAREGDAGATYPRPHVRSRWCHPPHGYSTSNIKGMGARRGRVRRWPAIQWECESCCMRSAVPNWRREECPRSLQWLGVPTS